MRSLIALPFLLSLPLAASAMRFATWNVRFDSEPDNITVAESIASLPGPLEQPQFLEVAVGTEQPWSARRLRVSEILQGEGVEIFHVQEALVRQVNDLQELLGNDWAWIGVGRDDGVQAGEYAAIFYKTSAFELLEEDHFWLSNDPFEPSKFPDAGSFRICTVGRFRLIATNQNFTLLNAHLDDQSDDQRKLGASMILLRARFEAATRGTPVIAAGDFNSPPTGGGSGAYMIATGQEDPVQINATFAQRFDPGDSLPDFTMSDLRGATPKERVSNTFATFTGFNAPDDTSDWVYIDFAFGGSNGGWSIEHFKVINGMGDDGVLASDHRTVVLDINLG